VSAVIDRILDERRINGRQLTIVSVVYSALVIDGIDVQLLALVAPLVLQDWGIGRGDFGPAMSAALLGSSFGSSIGGGLGDRFGRKNVLVAATLLFGVCTVLAAFTNTVLGMTLLRLVGGFGFGAALPTSVALVSEWLPTRARARVAGMTSTGTPLGGLLGAAFLIGLVSMVGWRGCFVLFGIVSLLFGLLAWIALPESPGYLVARGRGARAASLLSKQLGITCRPEDLASVADAAPSPSVAASRAATERVFDRRNLRLNLGSWLGFFGVYFAAYGIAAWSPVLLTGAGMTLPQALRASFAYNLCAVTSALVHGQIVTRFGSRRLLSAGSGMTLICVVLLAYGVAAVRSDPAGHGDVLVVIASAGLGAFNGAVIALIYGVLAHGFSPSCRAGGVGMAMMMGRAGGILSTFLGGTLLSIAGGQGLPFLVALGAAAFLALAGTLVIDRHVAPA
jgi:AAHS family 4-hydroxybenzoate transporter-like MFS transporter